MTRRRGRSRARTSTEGSLLRNTAIALVAIVLGSLIVQSAAFDTFQGSRDSDVDVAGDPQALVGIDLPNNIPLGNGTVSCTFGNDALTLTHGHSQDVTTEKDVIVTGTVWADIDTDGCVRVESGGRVDGTISAGGAVTLDSGTTVYSSVEAAGDVTLSSGSRITGLIDADGDVLLESGSRADGNINAGGDVTVSSGSRVNGDVTAGGSVTVENGGRVWGDIEEGVSTGPEDYPRLATIINNQNGHLEVTITLLDSSDGTLIIDGEPQGSSATLSLPVDNQQVINIDPSVSAGSSIDFQVVAKNSQDGTEVTFTRAVPTTNSGGQDGSVGNGGGDDSNNRDDDTGDRGRDAEGDDDDEDGGWFGGGDDDNGGWFWTQSGNSL